MRDPDYLSILVSVSVTFHSCSYTTSLALTFTACLPTGGAGELSGEKISINSNKKYQELLTP